MSVVRWFMRSLASSLRPLHAPQPQLCLEALSPHTALSAQRPALGELLDAIWLAAPKRKPSLSRRRMRQATQRPDAVQYTMCHKCGQPKLPHRICNYYQLCATPTPKQAKQPQEVATQKTDE